MSWRGFDTFKSVTGCNDFEAYQSFEVFIYILSAFIAAALATFVGTVYVVYRFWKEIALEVGCRRKYGADWKMEFERYHGSLSQAHLRLAVVFLCLVSLLVILGWIGRRFHRIHKHRKHGHAA